MSVKGLHNDYDEILTLILIEKWTLNFAAPRLKFNTFLNLQKNDHKSVN